MEIERLHEDAWSRLKAIRLAALATNPEAFGSTYAKCSPWPEARWRHQLRVTTTFVAACDGDDIGMVRCAPDPEAPTAVWLISMWVAPAARRRGTAGALIDAVLAWAEARGVTEVRLDVRERNRAAIALYERKGFAAQGDAIPEPPPNEHILERRFVRPNHFLASGGGQTAQVSYTPVVADDEPSPVSPRPVSPAPATNGGAAASSQTRRKRRKRSASRPGDSPLDAPYAVPPRRRDPSSYVQIDEDFTLEAPPSLRPLWASAAAVVTFTGLTTAAATLGARATAPRVEGWYAGLNKPAFTPPDSVFVPVWTGLYALIAISGWRVWRAPPSRARTASLALWGVQMVLNGAWSPLFFGRKRPRSALFELGALAAAVSAYALTARRVDRPAAALAVPYLGWVGFAGALNEQIVRRNPGL